MAVRLSAHTVDINAGTLDGVTIGGSVKGAVSTSALIADTADINGGTVDNVIIGGSTPLAGSFTTLSASSGLDNTIIGANTAAAGSFTTLSASGGLDSTIIGANTAAAGSFTTLDTTGDVGIGTATPSSKLEVVGAVTIGEDTRTQKDTFISSSYADDATSNGVAGSTTIQSGHSFDSGESFNLSGGDLNLYSGYGVSNRNGPNEGRTYNGGNINIFAGNTDSADNTGNTMIDGAIRFGKRVADLTNTVTLSEYGRWDASGNLLVGTTTSQMTGAGIQSVRPNETCFFGQTNSGNAGACTFYSRNTASTTTRYHAAFENPNGIVGSISTSGTATAYTTSSDYRLKENVIPMADATSRLTALKPSRFNFIADPDTTVDGFIAHEVQAVVPEAITGEKDAVDEEGNPQYQGIDQSKLVPLLVAAIQELNARIEALEA